MHHTRDLAQGLQEHRFLLCNEIEEAWTVAEDQATGVRSTKLGGDGGTTRNGRCQSVRLQ
jgi:hypothetical protein